MLLAYRKSNSTIDRTEVSFKAHPDNGIISEISKISDLSSDSGKDFLNRTSRKSGTESCLEML